MGFLIRDQAANIGSDFGWVMGQQHPLVVITREKRVIQYSRRGGKSHCRGVLDAPLAASAKASATQRS
jgi:hypothetical protein